MLAAHSLGGAYARRYAQLFPDEVAGTVHLDAFHQDWDAYLPDSLRIKAQPVPGNLQLRLIGWLARGYYRRMFAQWPQHVREPLVARHLDPTWQRAGARERSNMVRDAIGVGLAGCSIEDATGRADDPIYEPELAAERIAAAAEAAHGGPNRLVLTARAENYLHGRTDLADTIARLQRFQAAGADVLYAPGLTRAPDIKAVLDSVDRPVNVLATPLAPSVAELAGLGVSRVSVGAAFAFAALDALVTAARELLEQGTYGYGQQAAQGRAFAGTAFDAG